MIDPEIEAELEELEAFVEKIEGALAPTEAEMQAGLPGQVRGLLPVYRRQQDLRSVPPEGSRP